jgi:branched-chain amino acid transport system substrate-binding protein
MVRLTGMRHPIRAGSRWRAIAVAACLVAGVAACSSGSSSHSSSSSTPASSAASSAPASSAPATASSAPAVAAAGSVTNFAQYAGGSGKANPSLSPVTIGWVNEQGGPPSSTFPEATRAAQAVVKMINAELGGVHGHPVQLATCFIATSEAQGTTCGQQMINTKGVEAILEGLDAIGNASMYSVLGGTIPTLVGVSADPADDAGKNVFELEGSGTSATVAFGPFLRKQFPSAKTIAIAYQNLPGAVPISQGIQHSAQQAGFTVTMIPYSSTATDLIGPATEMEQADVTVPDCGFVDCPLMAKAIKEIGGAKPAISVPLFTDLPGSVYPGGDVPHWIAGEATANLAFTTDPGVAAYYQKVEQHGLSQADAISPFSGVAFGSLLLAVKLMNEIPFAQLSPSAITAKLKAYVGPIPLGPTSINCTGKLQAATPNVCSDFDQFFQYAGKGQWKLLQSWAN